MDNPLKPDSNSDPARPKSVEEFVEARLTKERLNNIWDRLQGFETRGGKPVPTYRWSDFADDFWTTLKVTRLLHKLVAGAAVTSVAVVICVLLTPSELVIRTPASWASASGDRLPDTLRFRLGKPNASLEGKAFALAGRLGGTTRSGSALTSLEASFSGSTADGAQVTFKGALVLTNAPNVVNIRSRHDFVGACLIGELTIGTNAPVAFEQPYRPE